MDIIKFFVIIAIVVAGVSVMWVMSNPADLYEGSVGVYQDAVEIDKENIISDDFIVSGMHLSKHDFLELLELDGVHIYGVNSSDLNVCTWYKAFYALEGWNKNASWDDW